MNYTAFKRLCKKSSASTNLKGKRQIQKFINCLFLRTVYDIYDSDILEYLEFVTQCIGALHTIDQFYCGNYTILLLKLSSKSQLQDPYYNIYVKFTGHFDSYRLNYAELQ